jgi:hypothetical protein
VSISTFASASAFQTLPGGMIDRDGQETLYPLRGDVLSDEEKYG